jgi:peptidoglycan hydrolase-like protein with peptidoglycan-binding domain
VVLVLAAGGFVYGALSSSTSAPGSVTGGGGSAGGPGPTTKVVTSVGGGVFALRSTTPSNGAKNVASNTTLSLRFTVALASGGTTPTLTPPVAGHWEREGTHTLVFHPTAPFVPSSTEKLTVPGGPSGIRSASGRHLAKTSVITFTIATGSTLRLEELLAELGYLPLSYTPPSTPAPQDMAEPQSGTLTWRWPNMPSQLTSQWTQGYFSVITKGAVMEFERENGLAVDGIPGPEVWGALLADVVSHKDNATPYAYVLVTKTLPEHLTAWVNGVLKFQNFAVNTGTRGATTHNGTFEVFEHVRESHMSGTDVTGTHYTITTVPWVSYFDGGDALHYYSRASYGFPQSNGCVEMQLPTAAALWPYTPIGTLVTIQGPTYGGTSSKNTISNTTA